MKTIPLYGEKHLTASALIITKEKPRKVLLLNHKKIDKWLQPGGHVEQFENPIEAVIREVKEETSLDVSFLLEIIEKIGDVCSLLPQVDFFLEETIPAFGNQPQHYHLDAIYIVELPYQDVIMQEEETNDIGWFTLNEALKLPLYENTEKMLKQVLS